MSGAVKQASVSGRKVGHGHNGAVKQGGTALNDMVSERCTCTGEVGGQGQSRGSQMGDRYWEGAGSGACQGWSNRGAQPWRVCCRKGLHVGGQVGQKQARNGETRGTVHRTQRHMSGSGRGRPDSLPCAGADNDDILERAFALLSSATVHRCLL
jgi:hypothetical protein